MSNDANFQALQAINDLLRAEPWMNADDWSIWRLWGDYPNGGGTFSDCLAMCLPRQVTGGRLLFKLLPLLDDLVTPQQIRRGIEMQLVERYPAGGAA